MRDLSESNVISIGFSSAPGKSACRFLLLPQPSVVVCGSPRHALSSRITIPPKYRSQKLGINALADTCLTLPFYPVSQTGENRAAQSLLVQELGWHLLLARTLPLETFGTRLGRVRCRHRGVPSPQGGQSPSRVLLCQASHCHPGRKRLSELAPCLVGSSRVEEPRKARGAPLQGLP